MRRELCLCHPLEAEALLLAGVPRLHCNEMSLEWDLLCFIWSEGFSLGWVYLLGYRLIVADQLTVIAKCSLWTV